MSGLWRCPCCGEAKPDGMPDTTWRLTGQSWEHKCPGNDPQAGYFEAQFFGGDASSIETIRATRDVFRLAAEDARAEVKDYEHIIAVAQANGCTHLAKIEGGAAALVAENALLRDALSWLAGELDHAIVVDGDICPTCNQSPHLSECRTGRVLKKYAHRKQGEKP